MNIETEIIREGERYLVLTYNHNYYGIADCLDMYQNNYDNYDNYDDAQNGHEEICATWDI